MVVADGPGDPLHRGVRRPVADEDLLVEPAYLLPADPSGQDRDVVEIRVVGHGRHRGVQVPGDKLGRQVVIEYGRQPVLPIQTRHAHPPIATAGAPAAWQAAGPRAATAQAIVARRPRTRWVRAGRTRFKRCPPAAARARRTDPTPPGPSR